MQVTAQSAFIESANSSGSYRIRRESGFHGSSAEPRGYDPPEAEQEQRLRQAISEMPTRCRQLIHMLFVEEPSRPYEQVAESLGLAKGSIGFIRQRCLERLRKRLLEIGVS